MKRGASKTPCRFDLQQMGVKARNWGGGGSLINNWGGYEKYEGST